MKSLGFHRLGDAELKWPCGLAGPVQGGSGSGDRMPALLWDRIPNEGPSGPREKGSATQSGRGSHILKGHMECKQVCPFQPGGDTREATPLPPSLRPSAESAGVNSGYPSPSGPPRACSELPSHCPPGGSGEHRRRAPPGAEKGHSRMQREDPAHVPLPGQQLCMGWPRAAVTPPTCCPKDSGPRGTVCCSTYCVHPAGLCSGSTYCVHPAGTQCPPCEARTGRWGLKGER